MEGVMANYCKRCLVNIDEEETYCNKCIIEIKNEEKRKERMKNVKSFIDKELSQAEEKAKKCTKCNKVLGFFDSSSEESLKDGLCSNCRKELEELKREEDENQRKKNMIEGFSYLVIKRPFKLANASESIEVYIKNLSINTVETVSLDIGEEAIIEVIANTKYELSAKIKPYREVNPITIIIEEAESVFINFTAKAVMGPYSFIFAKLSNEEMVKIKVIKREKYIDGEIITVQNQI